MVTQHFTKSNIDTEHWLITYRLLNFILFYSSHRKFKQNVIKEFDELCLKKSLFINSTFLYLTCVHQKKEEIQTFFVFFRDNARKMSVDWLELYFANFYFAFSAPSTLKR